MMLLLCSPSMSLTLAIKCASVESVGSLHLVLVGPLVTDPLKAAPWNIPGRAGPVTHMYVLVTHILLCSSVLEAEWLEALLEIKENEHFSHRVGRRDFIWGFNILQQIPCFKATEQEKLFHLDLSPIKTDPLLNHLELYI